MTSFLPWESCAGRAIGDWASGVSQYVSPPAASYLAKRLMREVATLSSRFSEGQLVVFSRLVSIAITTQTGIESYGLYESGADEHNPDLPNFCIRRSTWSGKFGDLQTVLSDLKCDTVFFNSSHEKLTGVLAEDFESGFSAKIIEDVYLNSDRDCTSSEYGYYSKGDIGRVEGDFFPKVDSVSYVERLYDSLKKTYDSSMSSLEIIPSTDKLRISYASLDMAEILNKLVASDLSRDI